jgi:hypothetical protein
VRSSKAVHLVKTCRCNSAYGPTLPTWAVQQVVGYLRYTGRDANIVAEAVLNPEPTCRRPMNCGLHRADKRMIVENASGRLRSIKLLTSTVRLYNK